MAQPVPATAIKSDFPSQYEGDLLATANRQANGHGGSSPARSDKLSTVDAASNTSTTSSTSDACNSSVLNLQPFLAGTTAVHGSQPVYGTGKTEWSIAEARHADPPQPLVDYFVSQLDHAALEPIGTRSERMRHVTAVLTEFQNTPTRRIRFVELEVPMRECNSKSGMKEEMFSYALYMELSRTRLVNLLRVKDYQPALDKTARLSASAELVGNNPHIRWIELCNCEFNDIDAHALAKGLLNNHAIKTLLVKDCIFSPDGW